MNTIAIIGCIVGVISCLIGISTFTSAQITRAKQDGVLIEKVDQCVKGIEEIKEDIKDRNEKYDAAIKDHAERIVKLEQIVSNMKGK